MRARHRPGLPSAFVPQSLSAFARKRPRSCLSVVSQSFASRLPQSVLIAARALLVICNPRASARGPWSATANRNCAMCTIVRVCRLRALLVYAVAGFAEDVGAGLRIRKDFAEIWLRLRVFRILGAAYSLRFGCGKRATWGNAGKWRLRSLLRSEFLVNLVIKFGKLAICDTKRGKPSLAIGASPTLELP